MMHKILALLTFTILFSFSASSQLEVSFASTSSPTPGGTVDIDVSVSNFDELVSIQYFVLWDSLVLTYDSILNVTTELPEFFASNVSTPDVTSSGEDGILAISWNQASTLPASIPDGTRLFTLRANVAGSACDSTAITIGPNPPQIIEIIDEDFNDIGANAIPLPVAIPGTDCESGGGGGGGGGSDDDIGLFMSTLSGDPGTNVCVNISVTNFTDIQSAQAGMMWDPSVLSYTGLQNFGLPGLSEGLFTTTQTDDGMLGFIWFDNSGSNPVTLADGTSLFEVCFDLVGAAGSSSTLKFIDSPDIEFSNSMGETLTFNTNTGSVSINDDGGGGGGGGGGDGDIGLIAGSVTADQGTNTCIPISVSGYTDVQSTQAGIMWDPTILSYTGATNFGLPGLSEGLFNANNSDDGMVSFIWFDNSGLNPQTLSDGTVIFDVCFDVIGSLGQTSTVKFINSPDIEFSNSSGEAITPFFTESGTFTVGGGDPPDSFILDGPDKSFMEGQSNTCIDITAENFVDIAAIQLSMTWNGAHLNYTSVENLNSGIGLAAGLFNQTGTDELALSWSSPTGSGQNVPNGTLLYSVCFDLEDCDVSGTFSFVNGSQVAIEIGDGDANPIPFSSNGINYSIACGTTGTNCINIGSANIDPVDCFGQSNGSISVNPTSCVSETNCTWYQGSSPSGTPILTGDCSLTGVPAGFYTVVVTDLTHSSAETFEIPQGIVLNITGDVTPVSCASSGAINTTITGGSGNYLCEWNHGATGCDISGLESLVYTVVVTDQVFGCQATQNFPIGSSSTLTVTPNASDVTDCSGGSITLNTNPVGSYNYTWSNPGAPNGAVQTNLPPGTYGYTVSDVDGNCSSSGSVTLNYQIDPPVTVENLQTTVDCSGSGGTASFDFQGGCAPLECTVVTPSGAVIPCTDLTGLEAGTYGIFINDSFLTPALSTSFVIDDAGGLDIEIGDIVGEIDSNDGSITVLVSGGLEPYIYTWSTGDVTTNNTLENIPGGEYSVVVTDANGCETSLTGIIVPTVITDPPVISDITTISTSCSNTCDGSINASISGAGPFTIEAINSEGQSFDYTALPLDGLCAGNYGLVITDANGLTTNAQAAISGPNNPLSVELDEDLSSCDDGTSNGVLSIATTGGEPALSYVWLPIGGTGITAENLPANNYEIQVTDGNGCVVSQFYTVEDCSGGGGAQSSCGDSNSVLTPNGDSENNTLFIECSIDYPNTLAVYDRWGRLVHESVNYDNSWTGQDLNNERLNEGAYFWVLDVTFDNGENRIFKGYVNIVNEN